MSEFSPGDLVFLTAAYDKYIRGRHPGTKIIFTNRLAKLTQIIDWESPSGQKIKEARVKSGKWKDLPIEDNKYIFSIFYHELKGRTGQQGVEERAPMFSKDPVSGEPFFIKVPEWIYKAIAEKCPTFDVQDK